MIQPKLCTLCGARHEPIFYLKLQIINGDGSKQNVTQGNICDKCFNELQDRQLSAMANLNFGTEHLKKTE